MSRPNYNKETYKQDFPDVGTFNWKSVKIKTPGEYGDGGKIIGVVLHDGNFMINGVLYLPHEFEIIDEYPFKKKGTINFNYWERGDYVRTPDGVGIVVENEKEINTELDLEMSEVLIQHKFGYSNNTSNEPERISRQNLILITKEEYNEEED